MRTGVPVFMQATLDWGVLIRDPDAEPGDPVRIVSASGRFIGSGVLDSPGPQGRTGGVAWHLRSTRVARPGRDASATLAAIAAYRRGALEGMDPDDPMGP